MKTSKKSEPNQTLPLCHSIGAAAGQIGVSPAILRTAKKNGADGFRANGNVDLLALARWALTSKATPTPNLETAKARLATARANQIERSAARETGDHCPVAEQARALQLCAWFWAVSCKGVARELASRIAPEDFAPLAAAVEAALRGVLANTTAAAVSQLQLPDWATEAIRSGAETGLVPGGSRFQERAEFFKEFLAGNAGEIFAASRAAQANPQ